MDQSHRAWGEESCFRQKALHRVPQSRASLVAQMIKTPPSMQETQIQFLVGKIPWRREWQLILGFLPGEVYGQRSLVGYSPWSCKESDMTEWLTLPLLRPKAEMGVAWGKCSCSPKVNRTQSEETGKIGRDPDIQVLVGHIESVTVISYWFNLLRIHPPFSHILILWYTGTLILSLGNCKWIGEKKNQARLS